MTLGITTTITCDGCANGSRRDAVTSWTLDGPPLGVRKWRRSTVLKDLGWKQFRKSKTKPRRDFCPDCVKAGRAV